jgi:hypothetical protein
MCIRGMLAFALTLVATLPALAVEDARSLAFATEFVRQLGAIQSLRISAEKERKASGGNTDAIMATCVRNSERFKLELGAHAAIMSGTSLSGDLADLPSSLAKFYQYKIQEWTAIGEDCQIFLAGPRPGVDFGKIAANAPKHTATLDYIDKAIFDATPLVFTTLIDQKPDAEGHLSHLKITRAQRDRLARSIVALFGKELDNKDANYTVSAAWLMKAFLTEKGYKCSDEP